MITREQVEDLKNSWACDPCFDLEDVANEPEWAGFREELLQYAAEQREAAEARHKERQDAHNHELDVLAVRMGIPGNRALAGYLWRLEQDLLMLTNTVADLD